MDKSFQSACTSALLPTALSTMRPRLRPSPNTRNASAHHPIALPNATARSAWSRTPCALRTRSSHRNDARTASRAIISWSRYGSSGISPSLVWSLIWKLSATIQPLMTPRGLSLATRWLMWALWRTSTTLTTSL